jgi:hypothetical protein
MMAQFKNSVKRLNGNKVQKPALKMAGLIGCSPGLDFGLPAAGLRQGNW